jgi:hypothetical protein
MKLLIRAKLIEIFLLLSLIALPGCVENQPSTYLSQQRPAARIDSVSASDINEGQTITFIGHGTDLGGTIVAYSWRSSIDGILNTSASFSKSDLSIGTHYIYFQVQNNQGEWSKEDVAQVNVYPAQPTKPFIFSFTVSSVYIELGASTNLEWNITGAITVNIQPDIGNVPQTGNRLVSPVYDTTYTLTATNISGFVSRTVNIILVPKESKALELFSIPEEEGFVSRFGDAGNVPTAGITATGIPFQAFFSFDLSQLPAGAKIISASLDLSQHNMYGYPFEALGKFGVFEDSYKIPLLANEFAFTFTLDGLIYIDSPPTQPFTSAALAQSIQKQIDLGRNRFQTRAQFAKFEFFIYHQGENYLEFGRGKTKLTIRYR